MSVPYKQNSILFYHKYFIKSLTRLRETLVKQRSKYKVQLINILDMIFPEFKPFLIILLNLLFFILYRNIKLLKGLLT